MKGTGNKIGMTNLVLQRLFASRGNYDATHINTKCSDTDQVGLNVESLAKVTELKDSISQRGSLPTK